MMSKRPMVTASSEEMDGYGDGDGYGYGYDSGYGDGSGSGSGSGYGYGYGYDYGDGYGDGDGHGYGDGYGNGDGNGDGNGYELGCIGDFAVAVLPPWPYVKVGCKAHSIDWWRRNWQPLAESEGVSITQEEVEELLCKATSFAAERTVDVSCSESANPSQ